MNTDLEPLAVLDVHAPDWSTFIGTDRHEELIAWAERENLPVNNIKRLEIYRDEVLFARVVEYALDEEGRKFACCPRGHTDHRTSDPSCGPVDAALRDPYDVPLGSLPPELAAREALGAAEHRSASAESDGPGAGLEGSYRPPEPPAGASGAQP